MNEPKVLVLGGTAEARDLASSLTEAGVGVLSSLAGRVSRPRLPVGPVRIGLIALAVALAAVVVSFCGIIGFVGLVGPHIARLAIGADHRHLLPFAALSGGLLLLVADAVGRTVIAPAVVPVGIVVAFIGGPVFIYLILTRRNTLK